MGHNPFIGFDGRASFDAMARFKASQAAQTFKLSRANLARNEGPLRRSHFKNIQDAMAGFRAAALEIVFSPPPNPDNNPEMFLDTFSYMAPDSRDHPEIRAVRGVVCESTRLFVDVMERRFPLEINVPAVEVTNHQTCNYGIVYTGEDFNQTTAASILMATVLSEQFPIEDHEALEDVELLPIVLPSKHGLFFGYAVPADKTYCNPDTSLICFQGPEKKPQAEVAHQFGLTAGLTGAFPVGLPRAFRNVGRHAHNHISNTTPEIRQSDAIEAMPVDNPRYILHVDRFIGTEKLTEAEREVKALFDALFSHPAAVNAMMDGSGTYFRGGRARELATMNLLDAPQTELQRVRDNHEAYDHLKELVVDILLSNAWHKFACNQAHRQAWRASHGQSTGTAGSSVAHTHEAA